MAVDRLSTANAVRSLRSGGVLLLATDTLPGLHCRADAAAAVDRIFRIKQRPARKSLLVLAGSVAQALAATGALRPHQEEACRRCWPGPFSLILPASSLVVPAALAGGPTVAIRVPDVAALRELILAVGVPLVSTSANLAGQPAARDLESAGALLGEMVDGCWGEEPAAEIPQVPSALVDLTVTPFRVLRPGPRPFPEF